MAVGKTSDASFEADVIEIAERSSSISGEWCGPCRMIAPALDEISGQVGDRSRSSS